MGPRVARRHEVTGAAPGAAASATQLDRCAVASRSSLRRHAALLCALLTSACFRAGFETWASPPGSDAGQAWRELGASATAGGVSQGGAVAITKNLALDPDDTPYVLWADSHEGQSEVYLRSWDGQAWVGLGSSASAGGISSTAGDGQSLLGGIAFVAAGRPCVTWMEKSTATRDVYLRCWDGGSWLELGGSASGRGISMEHTAWWPRILIDGARRPVVAWAAYGGGGLGGGGVHLRRWSGDAWLELAGSASGQGLAAGLHDAIELPTLAPGLGDAFHVAWEGQVAGTWDVYLAHWDGAAWSALGPSLDPGGLSASSTESSRIQLRAHAARVVVAWSELTAERQDFHVKSWEGAGWHALGASTPLRLDALDERSATQLAMDLDPAGLPVLVWAQDDALGTNIHGARWDGQAWEGLGSACASGGISCSAEASGWPSVAVARSGAIYVAWEQRLSDEVQEVHLRVLE